MRKATSGLLKVLFVFFFPPVEHVTKFTHKKWTERAVQVQKEDGKEGNGGKKERDGKKKKNGRNERKRTLSRKLRSLFLILPHTFG